MSTSRFHGSLTWRGAFAALFGLVLLASSCSDTTNLTAIPHAKGCQSEADCDKGLTCTKRREALGGLCHVDCETTESCALGERCVHADQASSVCQTAAESACLYDSDCFVPLICGPDQKCRDACKQDYDCIKPQKCTNEHVCAELNEVGANNELIMSFNVGPDGGRVPPDASGGTGGLSASGAGGGAPTSTGGTPGQGGAAGEAADDGESGAGGEAPQVTGPRPNPCDVDSSSCNPLKIVLAGTGKGRVMSDPVGIDCGAKCTAKFPAARAVVLSAVADQDSVFNGWSGGGCTGDRLCVVTPNSAPTITATFSPLWTGNVAWIKAQPLVTTPAAVFDGDGNAIITGSSTTAVDLGGTTVDAGTFVAKYDGAGKYVWARHLVGSAPSVVTTDRAGDVFFAGGPSLAIGAGSDQVSCPYASGNDLLIAKFAAVDGTRLWARCYPGWVSAFAVKATRNAVHGDLVVLDSESRVFEFSRLKGDSGALLWSQSPIHNTNEAFKEFSATHWGGLALDAEDNIFIGGSVRNGVDLGGGSVAVAGDIDGFVMKRTSAGAFLWVKTFGDSQNDDVRGVATDAAGNVAFTGHYTGQIDFGTGSPVTSAGGLDAIAGKYSADGKQLWAKRFGNAQDEEGQAISALPNGDFLIAGVAQNSLDVGGGPLFAPGKQDTFLVQLLGSNGSHVMSKGYGSAENDSIGVLAIDAPPNAPVNVLFTVLAGASIDLGAGPTASGGAFYVKTRLQP
jgi:Divergent InlB B-repeat domain